MEEIINWLKKEIENCKQLGNLQDEQWAFEQTLLKAQEIAIKYIRCCTELKDKEVIIFEEWLIVNKYKKLFDYFIKDGKAFTESELMQIYNDQVLSL